MILYTTNLSGFSSSPDGGWKRGWQEQDHYSVLGLKAKASAHEAHGSDLSKAMLWKEANILLRLSPSENLYSNLQVSFEFGASIILSYHTSSY